MKAEINETMVLLISASYDMPPGAIPVNPLCCRDNICTGHYESQEILSFWSHDQRIFAGRAYMYMFYV